MKIARMLTWLLIAAGLIGALSAVYERYIAERSHNMVEIALDWDEVQQLASSVGRRPDEMLLKFKSAGVTSLAVTEPTLGDYISNGQINASVQMSDTPRTLLSKTNPSFDLEALAERLRAKGRSVTGAKDLSINLPLSAVNTFPAGFVLDPALERALKNTGLIVIPRARNYQIGHDSAAKLLLDELKIFNRYPTSTLIFAGEEVIGWRGGVDQTAEAFGKQLQISSTPLHWGSIEFGKQKGSEKLEVKLKGRYIRVHSISAAEMSTYQPVSAAERFTRAARERGIRLLYVRLLETNGLDPVGDNLDYITQITEGLKKSGLQTGKATITPDPQPAAWQKIAIAFGAAAIVVVTLLRIALMIPAIIISLLAGLSVVFSGLAVGPEVGNKVLALIIAITVPILAVKIVCIKAYVDSGRPSLLKAVLYTVYAALIALGGGLMIAGLLSGRMFMTHTSQFAGVKLAHLIPILAIAGFALTQTLGTRFRSFGHWRLKCKRVVSPLLRNPVLYRHAVTGFIAFAVLLIVVMRSGNEAGVGVSPLELRFRAILDQILYVRPRTKEFLFGYPALLMGVWLTLKGNIVWGRAAYIGGVVALISVVNTFCHIHTPVMLSVIRFINGLWVGIAVALLLVFAIRLLRLYNKGGR